MPSFFFNDTATTEIYTLSLHDALPIWRERATSSWGPGGQAAGRPCIGSGSYVAAIRRIAFGTILIGDTNRDLQTSRGRFQSPKVHITDPKSTRLNSSHLVISYAVFFF